MVTLHEDAEGRDPLSSEQYVSKLGAERMLLHKMRWRGKACRTGMNDAMEHAVVKMQDHDGTYRVKPREADRSMQGLAGMRAPRCACHECMNGCARKKKRKLAELPPSPHPHPAVRGKGWRHSGADVTPCRRRFGPQSRLAPAWRRRHKRR